MLSDRIGAKVRGSQDAPPLSMAEKLLFAFCAAALVFVCLAGYTELDRQGKARAALTQVEVRVPLASFLLDGDVPAYYGS